MLETRNLDSRTSKSMIYWLFKFHAALRLHARQESQRELLALYSITLLPRNSLNLVITTPEKGKLRAGCTLSAIFGAEHTSIMRYHKIKGMYTPQNLISSVCLFQFSNEVLPGTEVHITSIFGGVGLYSL
jgi:hypothetical protein